MARCENATVQSSDAPLAAATSSPARPFRNPYWAYLNAASETCWAQTARSLRNSSDSFMTLFICTLLAHIRWMLEDQPELRFPRECTLMKRLICFTCALVVIVTSTPVLGQVQTVNRAANGQADTDIRVGVYANVQPDCTSGPLPTIQLKSPPGAWQNHC
jgi:hypothetical protein